MRVSPDVDRGPRGPLRRRSGRTAGLATFVLLVCAATSFISFGTATRADRAARATLDANRLQDALHRMSSVTWRAVALKAVDADVRQRRARARADFEAGVAELTDDRLPDGRSLSIAALAASFASQSDEVISLVTAGRSSEASAVGKGTMLPVYRQLDTALDQVGVSRAAEAARAGGISRAESLAVVPLAVAIVASVMVWNYRWRRKHEMALAEWMSAVRFDALVEATPIATFELDESGRIRHWSDSATAQLGWEEEDICGARPAFADGGDMDRLISAVLHGEALEVEGRWCRADGSVLDVVMYSSPLRDESGLPAGAIVAVADVTEVKRLTAQLHAAQKAETVGRLADGVAHDFNNLLTVIRGNADLLAERAPLAPRQQEDLAAITAAAETGQRLTGQLLALSGRQAGRSTPVDVNTVVRDFSLLLDQITGDDVHIAVELAAGPAVIEGHRAHVEQMLLNLAVNARDAMPEGGTVKITTELELAPDAKPPPATPGWVVIRVEDDGCGMDDDVKQHLFEPFFTTKRPGRGTGLGLTTVYTLVTQAGGAIDVASEPGSGTAVTLRLPFCPVPPGLAHDGPSPEIAVPAERSWPDDSPPAWQGETVLVVDDEAAVRQMIEATVGGNGGEIISAASAEEALERIAPLAQLSLVISDVHLPGMSGPDLVARLTAARPGLVSLLISGRARPEAIEPMRFLRKPFGPDQLSETLNRLSRPVLASQVRTPTEKTTTR